MGKMNRKIPAPAAPTSPAVAPTPAPTPARPVRFGLNEARPAPRQAMGLFNNSFSQPAFANRSPSMAPSSPNNVGVESLSSIASRGLSNSQFGLPQTADVVAKAIVPGYSAASIAKAGMTPVPWSSTQGGFSGFSGSSPDAYGVDQTSRASAGLGRGAASDSPMGNRGSRAGGLSSGGGFGGGTNFGYAGGLGGGGGSPLTSMGGGSWQSWNGMGSLGSSGGVGGMLMKRLKK